MPTSGRAREPQRQRLPNAERRAIILESARTVFIRDGYSAARMKAVAALSGVTEAVVYQHFGSKEALFEAAVMEPLQQLMDESASLSRQLASATDVTERDHVGAEFNRGYLTKIHEIAPLLGVALFANESRATEFYRRYMIPLFSQWAKNARSSLNEWNRDDLDLEFLARVNFGIPMMMCIDARFSGTELDLEALAREITDVMLRATTKAERLASSEQAHDSTPSPSRVA